MKIIPYLSTNRVLLTALISLSLIIAASYAASQKTSYSAYTYFNGVETKIVLGDPQLRENFTESRFTLSEIERGSKIYKIECTSYKSEEKAASDLESFLNDAHNWQFFVQVEPIRFSTTSPHLLKDFLKTFLPGCLFSIVLTLGWEKRKELFYEDEPYQREA